VTPTDVDVRSRVHEYGGGDFGFVGDTLVYAAGGEPGIQRLGAAPLGSIRTGARYADFCGSPDGQWLVAVEEAPCGEKEPENRLVAFHLPSGERRVLLGGRDFVSSPCFARDGSRLAFLAWDHPNMPWDGTLLYELLWSPAGPASPPRQVAGGPSESLFQPGYSPAGRLTVVSDRNGWWNLWQRREQGWLPLCPRAAEFGRPQWVFGASTWGFVSEELLVCATSEDGVWQLGRLDLRRGELEREALPFTEIQDLQVGGGAVLFVGAAPDCPVTLCRWDLAHRKLERLAVASELALASQELAAPEPLWLPAGGGRSVHAFLYRPVHVSCAAPPGERPPVIVKSHGGPTAAARTGLRPEIQYWTSRGFAVVDVNYAGSTGYGRAYRELLRGQWGVLDVADCEAVARRLAEEGIVDGERLLISGGSAGGFTTLCALVRCSSFRAGASHYGIGDLEALARDTHKFESRYLEGLVGPYPECRARYRERSPVHHADRISCPVAFFQGLEDRVVPPAQSEAMVAALARRGIPHTYVPFPGEGHGFRQAAHIQKALEVELAFYGRVLGLEVDGPTAIELQPGGPLVGRPTSSLR